MNGRYSVLTSGNCDEYLRNTYNTTNTVMYEDFTLGAFAVPEGCRFHSAGTKVVGHASCNRLAAT